MLMQKSWMDTRWRWVIGLVLMTCSALGLVFSWPQVQALLPTVPAINVPGELGERVQEALALARDYRGYVWSQLFRQNLPQLATLFAILLGTGGLLSKASGAAELYTLSLPVSRTRVLRVRAAAGLIQLLTLALFPALALPLISPIVGESYGIVPAIVHGLSLFVACTVFFCLAFFFSTIYGDVWRPLLFTLAAALALGLVEQILPEVRIGIFRVMSGETYFRTGHLPWLGLTASALASTAMFYGATVNIARRDF